MSVDVHSEISVFHGVDMVPAFSLWRKRVLRCRAARAVGVVLMCDDRALQCEFAKCSTGLSMQRGGHWQL